jgi:hypothetical protein
VEPKNITEAAEIKEPKTAKEAVEKKPEEKVPDQESGSGGHYLGFIENIRRNQLNLTVFSLTVITFLIIGVLIIVLLLGFVLRSPALRNTIRNVFVRNSSRGVRYSRVI